MSFKIKAADGSDFAVPAGEYYFNTKARGRRMMANSLSSDARRVYACLELATMGFQQELAVTMEGGKIRLLSPSDVCQQTKLPKQRVRSAFEELEDQGLAKREADDGKSLRRGHIRLYSWAEPHPTRPKIKEVAPRGYFPDWFPASWEPLRPFINRYKYSLIEDEVAARDYLEEGAEVARVYQNAEEVAARFLERVRAPRKDSRASLLTERTERTREITAAAAGVQNGAAAASPPAAATPVPEEAARVAEGLSLDLEAATQIVSECVRKDPSLTAEEIVELGRIKDRSLSQQPGVRSRIGLLRTSIPGMVTPGMVRDVRSHMAAERKKVEDYVQRLAQAREALPGLTQIDREETLLRYPELRLEAGDSP